MPKTSAAKAKGRTGQQEVRDKLLETFSEFEPDDIKSTTMGDTGEDIQLSPAARKKIPLSIEVKRRKEGLKVLTSTTQLKVAFHHRRQFRRNMKGIPIDLADE